MSPLRTIHVLVVALLVSAAGLVGVAPAYAVGSVSGTFKSSLDEPMDGFIYFQRVGETSAGGNTISGGSFNNVTRPDGDYKIFLVSETMDGTRAWYVQGNPAGSPQEADATVVTITDSTSLVINMVMPAIATLSGTITKSNGDPAPGVSVIRNRLGQSKSTVTDSVGNYSFGYVQAGTYTITTGSLPPDVYRTTSIVVGASGANDLDLQLTVPATISGTLTDSVSGDPIPYLDVDAYVKSTESYVTSTTTDQNGDYTLTGLPVGGIALRYSDDFFGYPFQWTGGSPFLAGASTITTSSGSVHDHDEDVTPVPNPRNDPHTMSGTVRDTNGDPLMGIQVITTADGNYTHTDRQGRWSLNQPAGSWKVLFTPVSAWQELDAGAVPWLPEYWGNAWFQDEAVPVDVPAVGIVDQLDVDLERAARIRLDLRRPGGEDDLHAGISLIDDGGKPVYTITANDYGHPDLDLLVRARSYRLLVSGESDQDPYPPLLPQYVGGGGASFEAATMFDLEPGDDLDLGELVLPSGLAAVTAPTVTGTPSTGSTLTGTIGAWNLTTGTTYAQEWRRGSTVVGSGPTYAVTAADVGSTLTMVVTATNGTFTGQASATASVPAASPPPPPPPPPAAKKASTTMLTLAAPKPGEVKVKVAVTGAGARPTGRVVVKRGTKVVARLDLAGGKAKVTLRKQPDGKQKYVATYQGSTAYLTSKDKAKVKVTSPVERMVARPGLAL